jgi:hypothetical protein
MDMMPIYLRGRMGALTDVIRGCECGFPDVPAFLANPARPV